MRPFDILQIFPDFNYFFLLRILGIISGIITLGLFIALLYVIFQKKLQNQEEQKIRRDYFNLPKKNSPKREDQWKKVTKLFHSNDSQKWRLAIIHADSMLERHLRELGFQGDSLGSILKQMNNKNVPWLDSAWEVHILRNKIAHEGLHYSLTQREAYKAFRIYEKIMLSS